MNCGKIVKEKKGDLFTAPLTMALGHCVSADNIIGGSLAQQFSQKYLGLWDIKKDPPTVGSFIVLEEQGRFVYSLVTKEKFYDFTTLTNLYICLQEMKNHMIQNHVLQLALPRLCCGPDRLLWADVYAILKKVLRYSSIEVTVFSLT